MSPVEIRVIEWVARGYEGSYTQYTIVPQRFDGDAGDRCGTLYISQVATQDNMARIMQNHKPYEQFGPLQNLRAIVENLVESRTADGEAVEIVSRDPRKCSDCEHFKFEHWPDIAGRESGCVNCKCKCTYPEEE